MFNDHADRSITIILTESTDCSMDAVYQNEHQRHCRNHEVKPANDRKQSEYLKTKTFSPYSTCKLIVYQYVDVHVYVSFIQFCSLKVT